MHIRCRLWASQSVSTYRNCFSRRVRLLPNKLKRMDCLMSPLHMIGTSKKVETYCVCIPAYCYLYEKLWQSEIFCIWNILTECRKKQDLSYKKYWDNFSSVFFRNYLYFII